MTRPGHDGMPPQGPEFAEFLRRELHAAADQFEPRSDGLERIRARVGSGPAYASKHFAAHGGFLADLVRRLNGARGGQEAGSGHPRQQRDWRYGLLRPALAAACAVFAIGVAEGTGDSKVKSRCVRSVTGERSFVVCATRMSRCS